MMNLAGGSLLAAWTAAPESCDEKFRAQRLARTASTFRPSVAAGILPDAEPGILPGGMGVWFEKSLPLPTSGPGGKMPPSTAAKMAAATAVNDAPAVTTDAT